MLRKSLLGLALLLPALSAHAQSGGTFEDKHQQCLIMIEEDAEAAHEFALQWKTDGGGYRAEHCTAWALFELGQTEMAAIRLQDLSEKRSAGTLDMRAGYLAEAAAMWRDGGFLEDALTAASGALEKDPFEPAHYVLRATILSDLDRLDEALSDYNKALTENPDYIPALRGRARIYLVQDNLGAAKADIDKAVDLDIRDIETLVLRGEINEAIRIGTEGD